MSKEPQRKKNQIKHTSKGMHPRNIHNQGYDFSSLIKSYPRLAAYAKKNAHGSLSIEFADPLAVKALNTALLKYHYNITDWDIPVGALCPPIPGRVDYIHYIAQLLGCDEQPALLSAHPSNLQSNTPQRISLLDIGTGANGIYLLLACKIYGWHCVGSDINSESLENVTSVIANNPVLKDYLELRRQRNKNHIFDGIIQVGEYFDVSVCNPPFYASRDEALKSNQRKRNNLAQNRKQQQTINNIDTNEIAQQSIPSYVARNFGGLEDELWCAGGERLFLKKLIKESQIYSNQCRWFTSLVSKIENIKPAKKLINKLGAIEVREIKMAAGNKITRILAWRFD